MLLFMKMKLSILEGPRRALFLQRQIRTHTGDKPYLNVIYVVKDLERILTYNIYTHHIYIDSDRRPVSNRRPLLKSASTDR